MTFDEAVELAREIMARPGWRVSWLHSDGNGRPRYLWAIMAYSKRPTGSWREYRIHTRERWRQLTAQMAAQEHG